MRNTNWRHFDFWLLGTVAVLTIFGITMIRSTIAGNFDLAEHSQRQLVFAIAGFVVLFGIASIDYHLWSSIRGPMYLATVAILSILFIAGEALFGSARWFQSAIINIQPSEFAKIVVILVLADFFTRNKEKVKDLRWILRSFLLTMGIVVWILLQPNLSTSIVILVIWFSLLWATGLQLRHLVLFSGAGLLAPFVGFPFMADYQQQRVLNFIAPDEGARHGAIYNVQQALISIGSGGWLGKGYGHGSQVQLRFLKVRHSDFIFSAMAEEFGFIGAVLVMFLLIFVIYRCLRGARLARDTFGALICYGVATLLAFQAMVNIGVNLNVLPATGLPLPFLSYGGSSLLSLLIGVGLVESVILRHKPLEF